MEPKEHYCRLENMYQAAPLNDFYSPELTVSEGLAEISIQLDPKLFHAGQAVHGSVYFKMLDDAAFFAANSLECKFFVLTTSFTTYLTKPISKGTMKAIGKIANYNRTQLIAEAVVYNSREQEVGRGSGIFIRSNKKLMDVAGYKDELK